MTNNNQKFKWDEKKLNLAKALSEGTRDQKTIGAELGYHESTISHLKQVPEFMDKVNEFTLLHERATMAGIVRELMNGMHMKREKIAQDKSTYLDFLKELVEVMGYKKQKIEHSGIEKINITVKKTKD